MVSSKIVYSYNRENEVLDRSEVQLGILVVQSPVTSDPLNKTIYKVSFEVLPVILTNPNTPENIKMVYDTMSKWASVVEPGGREWAYVGTDEGGGNRDQLGHRLMNIMGTGHELAVLLRCVNEIAWNYGEELRSWNLLAYLHGFTSPGGHRV